MEQPTKRARVEIEQIKDWVGFGNFSNSCFLDVAVTMMMAPFGATVTKNPCMKMIVDADTSPIRLYLLREWADSIGGVETRQQFIGNQENKGTDITCSDLRSYLNNLYPLDYDDEQNDAHVPLMHILQALYVKNLPTCRIFTEKDGIITSKQLPYIPMWTVRVRPSKEKTSATCFAGNVQNDQALGRLLRVDAFGTEEISLENGESIKKWTVLDRDNLPPFFFVYANRMAYENNRQKYISTAIHIEEILKLGGQSYALAAVGMRYAAHWTLLFCSNEKKWFFYDDSVDVFQKSRFEKVRESIMWWSSRMAPRFGSLFYYIKV